MPDPTDEEWLNRARAGDRAASQSLVVRHLPSILRYARRMLGNAHEAEDVAQETFLRLWQSIEEVEARATLRTWLFRVAHNLSIDRLRKKHDKPMPEDHDFETDEPSASERLADAERALRVERAVAVLPERQRAAISLVFQEGLRQTEAAEILGVTVDALESLLSRGRSALKKSLLDYDKEDSR